MSATLVADQVVSERARIGEYRRAQLAETLNVVQERSPFYRQLLGGVRITAASCMDVLRTLPPLTPAAWSEARVQMRTGSLAGAIIGYTSGTTSGRPSAFVSMPDDLRRFNEISADRPATDRTLLLTSANHGPAGLAGSGAMESHPIAQTPNFEQVALRLERSVEPFSSLAPVTTLAGTVFRMKELSLFLLQRRGRVDDLGVQRMVLGRNLLSPLWRQRLETWWGVTDLRASYGFSEMTACNTLSCAACGYHHMPPTCLAEVLDTDGESPVQPGGRGLLAVTGFHAYFSVEPRVRYLPGDIVELAQHPCLQWGERGFLPVGRRGHCVEVPTTGRCIGPSDVYAAVADHPEVHRFHPLPGTEEHTHDEVGSPRFLLDIGESGPQLRVELRYDPLVWPEHATLARHAIAAGVPHELDVTVHGPGHLGKVHNI